MSTTYIRYPSPVGATIQEFANFASFPSNPANGILALDLSTDILYVYSGGTWVVVGGSTVPLGMGALDGQAASANGATITANLLYLQSADATHPGLITTAAQNFTGQKTFATGLTGTLTGAASLNILTSARGNLTDAGTDGIVITGGTNATIGNVSIAQTLADATHNGYLSSTDWTTFNGKQASGSYITALTGDATASGPGSVALTFATVNSNVGSFGSASSVGAFTVNGKGLVTAASSTSIQIAESQVTNLVSDLAGKQPTGNYITALTGDATASGPGSAALTLATVNSNVGTFASVTVNGKGLVTAATALSGDLTTSSAVATLATVNSNVGSFGSTNAIPVITVNAKGLITAVTTASPTLGSTSMHVSTASPTGALDGTGTMIFGSGVAWDTNSAYNTGTGKYTAPTTGYYRVNFNLGLTGTFLVSSVVLWIIRKNSSTWQYNQVVPPAAGVCVGGISTLVQLTAGDTIEPRINTNAASAAVQADPNSNWFEVNLIGT